MQLQIKLWALCSVTSQSSQVSVTTNTQSFIISNKYESLCTSTQVCCVGAVQCVCLAKQRNVYRSLGLIEALVCCVLYTCVFSFALLLSLQLQNTLRRWHHENIHWLLVPSWIYMCLHHMHWVSVKKDKWIVSLGTKP